MLAPLLFITCVAAPIQKGSADVAKLSVQPPSRIAVLPVPNLSSDKWEELKAQECTAVRARAEELFKERGFEIVPDADVDKVVADSKLDIKDEEQWTKKNILSVGAHSKADAVIFIAIKQTRVKTVSNILLTKGVGEAQIESWLLEVSGSKPILDGVAKKGEKPAPPPGATGLRLGAVRRAVEATFEPILKPFAKVAKAGQ